MMWLINYPNFWGISEFNSYYTSKKDTMSVTKDCTTEAQSSMSTQGTIFGEFERLYSTLLATQFSQIL